VVEIAAAADGAALARDLVGSRGAPFIRLSLPFHQTADAARIRLARFDDASGVWTEVPGLTIRTSTSVISGRVQLAGRYTVVQAAADAVP
jgi:hypothetical protein